jgi:polygalacturonase
MLNINPASCGGKPDGIFDNTAAFTAALQEIKNLSGGVLQVSKGIWRTGPLEIFSNTTINLEEGAVLSFIPDPELYKPVWTRWEGVECYGMHPCIFAQGQKNISIICSGNKKAVIDGNGQEWWNIAREKKSRPQKNPETELEHKFAKLNPGYQEHPGGGGGRAFQFLRPPLMQFFNCSNIKLEGFTLRNSPFWTLHPVYCTNLEIRGLFVSNPHDAPNTDGIDIDSCEDVLIENCHVSVGDDGIAIKSGSGKDGIKIGKPSRRITVRGCTVENGHGGIVIGSETAAGISDLVTEDCIFKGTDRGIRIKTRRGRGGKIENLKFNNLTMENNLCPIAINMFYRCGADNTENLFSQEIQPVNDATPSVKNVCISNINASNCRASAGFIAGLPESPVENLSLMHFFITTDENSGINPDESEMYLGLPSINEKSIRLINISNLLINDIHVKGPKDTFIYK